MFYWVYKSVYVSISIQIDLICINKSHPDRKIAQVIHDFILIGIVDCGFWILDSVFILNYIVNAIVWNQRLKDRNLNVFFSYLPKYMKLFTNDSV